MTRAAIAALVLGLAAPAWSAQGPRCGSREETLAWRLTLLGFGKIFPLTMTEVDGALEGRFFPKTTTFALTGLEGKHFIRLRCRDEARGECDKDRDTIEFRTVAVSLLRVIGHAPENELFDPKTWRIRSLGWQKIAEAKKCHPDLWERLADIVTAGHKAIAPAAH